MIESMFHLQAPLVEKIVRPIIVYFFLILLLRIFGKRELAQLNPFDLGFCCRCRTWCRMH